MRRAIVSIVCAYSRIASSAPSSPQPATYGIDSPPTSRPTEPQDAVGHAIDQDLGLLAAVLLVAEPCA